MLDGLGLDEAIDGLEEDGETQGDEEDAVDEGTEGFSALPLSPPAVSLDSVVDS